MEEVPVEHDYLEYAEVEEVRVRQSEVVNMQAIHLQRRLEALLGEELGGPAGAAFSSLPSELVEALGAYAAGYETDMERMATSCAALEREKEAAAAKTAALMEKAERVRSESAFLSEKSSANLKVFRQQLRQSGECAKERNREIVTINRKREKAEMDIKRTNMEIERLRKISKRTK